MRRALLIFIVLLLTGCDHVPSDNPRYALRQKVLFQFEYVNYAWGFQHRGWLINSSGELHCYNLPDNWNFPDSTGTISATDMEQNLQNTDSICYQINPEVLKAKFLLLPLAAKGPLSDPVSEMADAGSAVYAGYILDQSTNRYERILLQQLGDIRIENRSQQAHELYEWLQSVNQEISK
ncbi:hypothetical protein [Prolixibacter denitrificans]|nr:hypothetical protein [Prolixibacter denitrificans]PSK83156.1 hypothetical protein CLV93_10486 [Prolixibacter denitrificans]